MKNLILTIVMLAITYFNAGFAQSDSIKVFRIIGGYEFQQHNTRLNRREMVNIMKPNPSAQKLMIKSNSTFGLSIISACVGGGLIGYPIGVYIAGGEPNWIQLGAGIGLGTFSIILGKSSDKKALKAVGIYNSGLSSRDVQSRLQMGILFKGNQLGVMLTF
jgi:hypothetical protein